MVLPICKKLFERQTKNVTHVSCCVFKWQGSVAGGSRLALGYLTSLWGTFLLLALNKLIGILGFQNRVWHIYMASKCQLAHYLHLLFSCYLLGKLFQLGKTKPKIFFLLSHTAQHNILTLYFPVDIIWVPCNSIQS